MRGNPQYHDSSLYNIDSRSPSLPNEGFQDQLKLHCIALQLQTPKITLINYARLALPKTYHVEIYMTSNTCCATVWNTALKENNEYPNELDTKAAGRPSGTRVSEDELIW